MSLSLAEQSYAEEIKQVIDIMLRGLGWVFPDDVEKMYDQVMLMPHFKELKLNRADTMQWVCTELRVDCLMNTHKNKGE